jgi:hypothetical protein
MKARWQHPENYPYPPHSPFRYTLYLLSFTGSPYLPNRLVL